MYAHDFQGTPKPKQHDTGINEATEPDHDADSIATFNKVKATAANEPAQKQTPTKTARATPKPAGRASSSVAEEVVNALKPLLKNQTQEIEPDYDAESMATFEQVKATHEPVSEAAAATPAPAADKDAIPDEILNPDSTDELLSADPPKELSEKGKADWTILRDLAITNKTENATLSQQLAEAKQRDAEREAAFRENQLADENYDAREDELAFSKAAAQAAKEIAPLREVEGNELWNAQVAARREEAKSFFSGQMSLEDAALYAFYAVSGKAYAKMVEKLSTDLRAARTELGRLKPAQPTAGDYGRPAQSTTVSDENWYDPANVEARFNASRAEVG